MKCPECGGEMVQGYIRGAQAVLHWVDHESNTGLGGEVIAEGWWKGPHLSANRCEKCRLIVTRY